MTSTKRSGREELMKWLSVLLLSIAEANSRRLSVDDLAHSLFYRDLAQNPDQQPGAPEVSQGDINGNRSSVSEERSTGTQPWSNNVLPYVIEWHEVHPAFHQYLNLTFQYVFNYEYKKKLGDCITLCPRDQCPSPSNESPNFAAITFQKEGCYSSVGMIGGRQIINLDFPSCIRNKGTVAHEIMHTLGFYHEHARPDRDDYVYIAYINIEEGNDVQFYKQPEAMRGIVDGYDFHSVMHYDAYAFRKEKASGVKALTTRTIYPSLSLSGIEAQLENYGRGAHMGQRLGLSHCDELKIRRLYSQPGIEGGKICELWTPRTCRCKAINKQAGYDKAKCEEIMAQDPEFNQTTLSRSQSPTSPRILQLLALLAVGVLR